MLDPAKVALWTGALIGAGTIVSGAVKFFFYLYDEIKKRIVLGGHGVETPRESLRIALKNENAYWWHMGAVGANPAMQIVGDFFITNISDRPVRLPQMELRYGLWGRKKVHGAIMVEGRVVTMECMTSNPMTRGIRARISGFFLQFSRPTAHLLLAQ